MSKKPRQKTENGLPDITLIKEYNPVNGRSAYRIKLGRAGFLKVPAVLPEENGVRPLVLFGLHDGAVIPEKDLPMLINGAYGFVFKVVNPVEADPAPEHREQIKKLIEVPEIKAKIEAGHNFSVNPGDAEDPDDGPHFIKGIEADSAEEAIKQARAQIGHPELEEEELDLEK